MSDFVIIPDSSSDLTKELRNRFRIPECVRGIVYFPDGHEELSDIDWEKYDPKTFYESMSDKKTLYKTACPPVEDIISVYERYLKEGKDILAICLSSALSGTYQICEMIKGQLLEKYPERKIICIDSMRYSTALSLLIIMAAMKQQEGATLEETAAFVESNKHRIHQMGPMDDLFFLCKTGRISNYKAFFGTLVGINPMADFNRQGLSEVLGKFKGKKAAFDAVIKYMRKTVIDPENQIMFVAHSNRPQAAELLREMIISEFHPKEVIINHVGMSCGASIGPGLCAAFYFGTEISEGMAREKEIMDTLIKKQAKK
ncbi:MAG: DegV family protein [Clostridia bacterium]|nr:DegV family protein [Clostridia bacterium]